MDLVGGSGVTDDVVWLDWCQAPVEPVAVGDQVEWTVSRAGALRAVGPVAVPVAVDWWVQEAGVGRPGLTLTGCVTAVAVVTLPLDAALADRESVVATRRASDTVQQEATNSPAVRSCGVHLCGFRVTVARRRLR
jgi:hypothetical protein